MRLASFKSVVHILQKEHAIIIVCFRLQQCDENDRSDERKKQERDERKYTYAISGIVWHKIELKLSSTCFICYLPVTKPIVNKFICEMNGENELILHPLQNYKLGVVKKNGNSNYAHRFSKITSYVLITFYIRFLLDSCLASREHHIASSFVHHQFQMVIIRLFWMDWCSINNGVTAWRAAIMWMHLNFQFWNKSNTKIANKVESFISMIIIFAFSLIEACALSYWYTP